jgi:hypothetical protein
MSTKLITAPVTSPFSIMGWLAYITGIERPSAHQ